MIERMLSLVPLAVLLWWAIRADGLVPLGLLDRMQVPCWELGSAVLAYSHLIAPLLWAAAIALPVAAWTQGIKGVE